MPANRLLPQQFAAGTDISATRIEQSLAALVATFNDVPADLVKRRWCPSHVVAGYSPSQDIGVTTARQLPWMQHVNSTGIGVLEPPTSIQNTERVKSCAVPQAPILLVWELAFANSRPVILSALSMFAEAVATGPFTNPWQYGGAPPTDPPGLAIGGPTTDFTFQLAVDDGWDVDNRRKLRQEVLVWRLRADAFDFDPTAVVAADTLLPPSPVANGVWRGHALTPTPLVLLPVGARARVQMTVPRYIDPVGNSTWGAQPWKGNAWTMHAEILEATR